MPVSSFSAVMDRIVSLCVRACVYVCVCNSYGFSSITYYIYIPVAVKRVKTCFHVFVCIVDVVRSDVLPQPSDETVLAKARLI